MIIKEKDQKIDELQKLLLKSNEQTNQILKKDFCKILEKTKEIEEKDKRIRDLEHLLKEQQVKYQVLCEQKKERKESTNLVEKMGEELKLIGDLKVSLEILWDLVLNEGFMGVLKMKVL